MKKSILWTQSALDQLGKVKDMDIATEFSMSRATVRNKRIELGIPAYDELKWTAKMDEQLGAKTDVKLAEELGISVKSVRRRRAELNIPAHEKTIWTTERESLLGTKPDTEIAKMTGLTIEQVTYRRRKVPPKLTLQSVTKLCESAMVTPPSKDCALTLQAKYTQASAKLKRWERARTRKPDFREMQANDNTKDE